MPERYYEQKHFIEDISLYFEQMGIPRMAGRILGVLLISNPPEQSIDDLCERLQASKSAVSTSARLLSEMGLIEARPIADASPHLFSFSSWRLGEFHAHVPADDGFTPSNCRAGPGTA